MNLAQVRSASIWTGPGFLIVAQKFKKD